MTADTCSRCDKEFLWYWRWRYSCERCNATVCSDCLSFNFKGERVCDRCHFCSKCSSEVFKNTLTEVRSHRLCEKCYNSYLENISNWIPGTKNEYLRDYYIVKEIGLIKVEGKCIYPPEVENIMKKYEPPNVGNEFNIVDECRCKDPAEVESVLKTEVAVSGGNSYIKFFWDKHIKHHEEEYEAGRGSKGNPYYKTRRWTTQYFTGHAIAVIAHPDKKKRK